MTYLYTPGIHERNVGDESKKTFHRKLLNGFFDRYMSGEGCEIGSAGYTNTDTILPTATAVNLDYPGYDGVHLPFPDNSQNWLYSSHVLEHIADYKTTIKEWMRVIKPGGFLVVVVPLACLYEKKDSVPSFWNADHKRFYSSSSLCKEIEESLPKNTFRIRHLQENDLGYEYRNMDILTLHAVGEYEVQICVEKL